MAFLLALLYFLSIFSSTYILGQDHSYAPQNAECPSTSLIRAAGTVTSRNQALGTKESLYIRERRKTVVADAYEDYMKNVESSMRRNRARLPEYVKRILLGPSDHLPRVSGAMSGGGLRASFVGAGILNALDGRNQTSASKGTGGLLQVMDYITGLSGGACLVMSLSQANFPSIYELTMGSDTDATEGWLAEMNFVAPAGLNRILENPLFLDTKWWVALGAQVSQKALAGFEVSLGDVYSRILAYHFVNGTTRENFFDPQAEHGLEERLSDLSSRDSIKSYSQPFPIITSVAESPGQGPIIQRGDAVPLSNNQYEFNMYESGSWDPNLASFIETSYLGSPLENGRPSGAKACVKKFDNLGFLVAASSNIFRKYDAFATLFQPKAYRSFLPALKGVLSLIPNPFYGLGTSEYLDRNSKTLQLMDGSFGGENIPFAPLLVPAREVDAIVAFDASDDVNGWPDGTSLKATSRRSKLLSNDVYPFPRIPESLSQIKITRPTFFGCDEPEVPLVIYIPNSPSTDGSTEATNLPTASLEVSQSRAFSLIEGGTKLASRGISNDPLWPGCLACAVVERSRERSDEQRQGICSNCFQRYCFHSM
ncbi:Lysophospholipase 1 [Puccinia graminis f. sp. tritici]|uniref:Lysophospholipase n=1 Tax=Puccinia graminis f. sp. tritici TaxID=56615 RepID=A0A5B0N7V8_PUCGR|nr:Lysophospholipase 1 [Puccinia graminis f. sp. tritici]KAA1129919.1 Lysophospholipase 1 [Puccinia graminis f. sp. tritici]